MLRILEKLCRVGKKPLRIHNTDSQFLTTAKKRQSSFTYSWSLYEGILRILARFPALKVLRLQGSGVSAQELIAIRAAMPNCQIEL